LKAQYPVKGREIVEIPMPNKIVCKNEHMLAMMTKKKGNEVIEIKCQRRRHYVYVLIDHIQGQIKTCKGSILP